MNLYVDDNLAKAELAGMLFGAGHQVTLPTDVALEGKSDPQHFEHAIRSQLVVLTADRSDFAELDRLIQTAGGHHPGILIVRFDGDSRRDMMSKHIVRAIANVEAAGVPLPDQVVILNQWR
jgi:predicted nuclease of predicted toxin-antitoxin system